MFAFFGPPPAHARGPRPSAGTNDENAPPKPQWTLPPPPGLTLRQRIEKRERELGLRCSDISCGVGPTDDDPETSIDVTSLRQIGIKKKDAQSDTDVVCEHKFHPACLVSAERVAGWGGEDKKEDKMEGTDEDVEVSCPVCRAVGYVSRTDWEEGACALA
ncbi:hypothetical protein K474DRAFT_1591976 [Panus rudis PR-1116 ss-1]|nr:hypothetical protein K474DRAFT_1591976 [Panus rudis PR-1116 ss-1]